MVFYGCPTLCLRSITRYTQTDTTIIHNTQLNSINKRRNIRKFEIKVYHAYTG